VGDRNSQPKIRPELQILGAPSFVPAVRRKGWEATNLKLKPFQVRTFRKEHGAPELSIRTE